MKYSLAFATAISGAFAATMIQPGQYGAVSSPVTSAQAVTTSAPAGPSTSTAFVTDVETIYSCGPEVTSCPYRSTTPVQSVPVTTEIKTTAPATSKPVTSETPKTTAPATTEVKTTEIKTTAPATSKPVTSETPKTTAPATTEIKTTAPATSEVVKSTVPAPPVPVLSTQAIETCVPTTIYKTITVTSSTSAVTTAVATTKAPYGTAPAPYKPTGGVASGTGVGPRPSTTAPIAQGAASGLSVSFSGLALVAAAAVLFA